jgi:predicted glycogen debranching enzyme
MSAMDEGLQWGREACGDLATAERREWLCTNGLGGFASGTVAGLPTRRYHGLLVAALKPPLGRTVLGAHVHETVTYAGETRPLATGRWASGVVEPAGFHQLESFRLDGTSPVWTYACADALIDKRIWMEPGANTTYVRYSVVRARGPVALTLRVLVNHRDYHATTRAGDWRMDVTPVADGVRVTAFEGARPLVLLAPGAEARPAHDWYRDFDLARERERGLDYLDDALHAVTFASRLAPGASLTLVVSAEAEPAVDGEAAWGRRKRHETEVLRRWQVARGSTPAPAWIRRLVLAADQFIARRPAPEKTDGLTVLAGYHWFGDWGRDTMIALPGLTLTTGRPDAARAILTTFARFVDRGMLPNRFPDTGEPLEYNTVDATLWYVEALRAYHASTGDDGLLKELFPVLEDIVAWHCEGTRYGIRVDPADGLLACGEPGVQLTWMDARLGDWVVTPRTGKPVEINALWFNALRAVAAFAARLQRPVAPYRALADRVAAGFERFWYGAGGYCHDVIDTPTGDDPTLRPNQIFAVSLPESPLSPARQRAVVDVCAARLLTSHGLRTLAPDHPQYRGRYGGDQRARDSAYHQGTVWAWLLGPFALAHYRVYGDAEAARSFLGPMVHHLADYGLGSIAEIFEGDPPFRPAGCVAQAWSVAEVLRAWQELEAAGIQERPSRGRRA